MGGRPGPRERSVAIEAPLVPDAPRREAALQEPIDVLRVHAKEQRDLGVVRSIP